MLPVLLNGEGHGPDTNGSSWRSRFTFLSSPAYGVICLSNFLFFMVLGVPFTFGPDLLLKRGLCTPDLSSYMITCIGLANMAGQIGVGGFADLPWVDSSVVTGVAMVVSGASVAVLPVCATYVQACRLCFLSVFGP